MEEMRGLGGRLEEDGMGWDGIDGEEGMGNGIDEG